VSPAPSAPRSFEHAAPLALPDLLADRFRWDGAARTWRTPDASGAWRPVRFEVVQAAATDALFQALSALDPPLVFRCVFAPDTDAAEAVTDWQAERDTRHAAAVEAWEEAEARRVRDRERAEAVLATDPSSLDPQSSLLHMGARRAAESTLTRTAVPRPFVAPSSAAPVLPAAQRERLLAALRPGVVGRAVRVASGLPAFAYAPAPAAVEVDCRAWLAALPRPRGARLKASALYAAYVEALPATAHPLTRRAFHAQAVEVLGDGEKAACQVRDSRHVYYLGLSLPASSATA
jgi:hypothetical protein